ncbi:hypothetical protein RB594_006535 [Gaeumannomyces avenae]
MAPRALAGMSHWAPRTRPRPIHVRSASPDTLSAFMGFIATLVHSTSHSRLAGRHCRSYRVPRRPPTDSSGHGLCRHDHPHPLAAAESGPSSERRCFHNYFVTHLPSSSLHPDPRLGSGPHHKLPRSASIPHTPDPSSRSLPAASPPVPRNLPSRDLTVVRIPLRSAKHHFGAHNSRGTRAYNEDENQAGTIDLPAFARRAPVSLSRSRRPSSSASSGDSSGSGEGSVADSASGDPQIFYFGVFDGHGGNECSAFLRDELHGYIEETAVQFGLGSSLRRGHHKFGSHSVGGSSPPPPQQPEMKSAEEVQAMVKNDLAEGKKISSDDPEPVPANVPAALRLERELLAEYKDTVGGYFRRFKPPHFSLTRTTSVESTTSPSSPEAAMSGAPPVTIESVLTYAFLRADLDFVTAQARKPDPDDAHVADFPVNRDEVLGAPHARHHHHHHHHLAGGGDTIGGPSRFKGGSTATVALVSTPTPQPFWHPSAHSTLLVAHVGDSRALLCETATGLARPLSNDHHPSSPLEARRLRRFFAAGGSLATDSFGEERLAGLANSRAFGDLTSKRLGVSAEPEMCRTDLGPAEYSFLVLASDGVSGTLSDQEIVDVVKEARTPEQGAHDVVEYATEVSADGDNATCLVVRLGGWERRSEGGVGSLGTKEIRDVRRAEAQDPRRGRR